MSILSLVWAAGSPGPGPELSTPDRSTAKAWAVMPLACGIHAKASTARLDGT